MKKPITFLLVVQTILLLATTAVMLSSCVIVHPDDEAEIFVEKKNKEKKYVQVETVSDSETQAQTQDASLKYTITCKNETDRLVINWFVKNDNIITLSKTGFTGSIQPHGEDMIFDLPKGYYKVYFFFEGGSQKSYTINLDKDVTYCILDGEDTYISECRSVEAAK